MKPVNRTFSDNHIVKIEEKYNAKYVIDSCLFMSNESWMDSPAAIFYTEEPHPQGSNYFALYWSTIHDGWMITDGIKAVQGEFNGFLFEDGELVHSRYRHDYFEHREAMVDGGRDYFRSYQCPKGARPIKFKVVGSNLVLI